MNAAPSRPMTLGARVGVRTGWSRKSGQERLVYRLLLPVFGTVFVLATIPFVMAVIEATTAGAKGFVGLDNFKVALGNPALYEAVKQTVLYGANGRRPAPVAVVASAGTDRHGQCRHLAVDAVRLPRDVRRPADGAQRIGRGGAGRRRELVDAVPPHRAAVPAAPVAAGGVLPPGRRRAGVRPRVRAHRRRPRHDDPVPEPVHLSDRLPVHRPQPGIGAG